MSTRDRSFWPDHLCSTWAAEATALRWVWPWGTRPASGSWAWQGPGANAALCRPGLHERDSLGGAAVLSS